MSERVWLRVLIKFLPKYILRFLDTQLCLMCIIIYRRTKMYAIHNPHTIRSKVSQ